jgi:hypothetical protein
METGTDTISTIIVFFAYNDTMTNPNELPCGCRWIRDPSYGDVLVQCEGHRDGAEADTAPPYEGSLPGPLEPLLKTLADAGARPKNNYHKATEGHVYRHSKGGEYLVLGVATHTETGEELVVYRSKLWTDNRVWARPRAMFEEIDENGVHRFTFTGWSTVP